MKRKRFKSFIAGFSYSSKRLYWDRAFVITLFLLFPLCFILPYVFIASPNMCSDSFANLSWTNETAMNMATHYTSDSRLGSYYSILSYYKLRPGEYFVLGGKGEFGEASIFVSSATRLYMVFPLTLSLFAIALSWFLFYSFDAKNAWKNLAGPNLHKSSFILGKTAFYFLILFVISAFFGLLVFMKEDKRALLEFSNGRWSFPASKANLIWLYQYAYSVLNSLVFGAIVFLIGRLFEKGKNFVFVTALLFVPLSMMLLFFGLILKNSSTLPSDLVWLSWLFYFGPFLSSTSPLKALSWFGEWLFLLLFLFGLNAGKKLLKKKNIKFSDSSPIGR